jgi:uncharacterized protein
MEIGQYHTLTILRHTSVGLYLGDEEGEDVLLPNKYCPDDFTIGDTLRVFVYRDFADRKVATNLTPKIFLNEYALLKVTSVNEIGAFLDWGLEKDLLVPFREQRKKMEEGRWYIVYLDIDSQTDRLFASNKIDNFLQNSILTVEVDEEVDLLIYRKTDLGYSAIVNNIHDGLIFQSNIFKDLNIGERMKGYVKNIRPDNKLDISLQSIGYWNFNDPNCDAVLKALKTHNGFLPLTDNSSPEEVYKEFGISKKAFKKAVGALYKSKKISLTPDGIKLNS